MTLYDEMVVTQPQRASVRNKGFQALGYWILLFAGAISATILIGYYMIRHDPSPSLIAWIIYVAGAVAIIYQPRWGIYLILFFALVGDSLLLPWYPFVKNFSSAESIFFLSNSLIFNPMEVYVVLTFVSWLGRSIPTKKVGFYKGDMFLPAVFFLLFITFGLFYGIVKGGNLNIALWEVRPFYYLFAMLVLSSNLLTRREHFRHLFTWATAALVIEGIVGAVYFFVGLKGSMSSIAGTGITEHSAAIHINTVFVLILAAWMYRGSLTRRFSLLAAVPFLAITYLASQRRAAIVSLAVALLVLAVLLFFENRRLFWYLIPTASVAVIIYVAAFWNSSGTLGFPAQAIKSVVAQGSSSERNQSSNIYRVMENIDTSFTIHQHPLTGVGFGNTFYLLVPLPDISFFIWWNYLPHNSIIYIWVKSGVGGFLAMLFFVGTSILTGSKAVMRTQDRETKMFLVTGLTYIVMHFLYAYVDISWDAKSMLYLGAVIGMLNIAEQVLRRPDLPARKRYPWQPEPSPLPGLLP